jgi:muconate cycloisomerase
VWDWLGKATGQPIFRLLGLDINAIVHTSVTIGINPPEVVEERVTEVLRRTGARRLKVKLGSPDGLAADKGILTAAQNAAKQLEAELGYLPSFRVDANGGWDVTGTLAMAEWLSERGVEYIEQPIIRGKETLYAELKGRCALPVYSDESICIAADIPPMAPYIAGINIKLMKCGGISEALNMIGTARAHGLRIMYGCMSETSVSITAAAHISPLADELDLDSHLNLNPDPWIGALWQDGCVVPTDAPGLGVTRR